MFFLRSFLVFIPFCVCVGRANQVTHSRQLNGVDLKQTLQSFVLDQCINNLWSYFFYFFWFYSHLYTTKSTCWTSYKRTVRRSPVLQKRRVSESEVCSVGRSSSLFLFRLQFVRQNTFEFPGGFSSSRPSASEFGDMLMRNQGKVASFCWKPCVKWKIQTRPARLLRGGGPRPEVEGGVAGGPSKTCRGNGQKIGFEMFFSSPPPG